MNALYALNDAIGAWAARYAPKASDDDLNEAVLAAARIMWGEAVD
jgi:hypothetical protein